VSVAAQLSPSGYSALHLACLSGHVGVVGLLLSRSTELLKARDALGQETILKDDKNMCVFFILFKRQN
jgi:ankyrin repeat protein